MDAIGVRIVTTVVVRPIYEYNPVRDAILLQMTRKVAKLIEDIINEDGSGPDNELEQRQRELSELIRKILTQKKYLGVREVVVAMFERIGKGPKFTFLDKYPAFKKM